MRDFCFTTMSDALLKGLMAIMLNRQLNCSCMTVQKLQEWEFLLKWSHNILRSALIQLCMLQVKRFTSSAKSISEKGFSGSMNGRKFKELRLAVIGFVVSIRTRSRFGIGLVMNCIQCHLTGSSYAWLRMKICWRLFIIQVFHCGERHFTRCSCLKLRQSQWNA